MGVCCGCCAEVPTEKVTLIATRKNAPRKTARRPWLLVRGVVPGLGINIEGRKSLGWPQFDLDLPPGAVVSRVARFVSEDILISELHSDLRGNIRQFP